MVGQRRREPRFLAIDFYVNSSPDAVMSSGLFTDTADSHDASGPEADGDSIDPGAVRGEYTWADFFAEFDPDADRGHEFNNGHSGSITDLDRDTSLDIGHLLGIETDTIEGAITEAVTKATNLDHATYETLDPTETPVRQGDWSWHHYVRACVDSGWDQPTLPPEFSPSDHLGPRIDSIETGLARGHGAAKRLNALVDDATVNVQTDFDEDAFFQTADGVSTVVTRYDLEKTVPHEKKGHFREVERYWTNKPYAFVVIFHSEKENETKYYVVEPYLTAVESEIFSFLTGKLRTSIKYADDILTDEDDIARQDIIERETRALLARYDILETPPGSHESVSDRIRTALPSFLGGKDTGEDDDQPGLHGSNVRPEPALLEENSSQLTEFQVEKLLYHLRRNFIGYQRIDPIKHDINVEDISCDGYNSPVFVYHTEYEQIITNVFHGKESLDDFVVKLAQRSGKGISKRQPQVDATLPDGSRAQLTLGKEVSDHGTNYTIRQFNDVPFTPVDLINWRTFSLDQMAFLWLCIENHKSLIFAGGTASGKTTSLNAVSLFIPSASKIVSIEDTREVELPQRNWIASVTRPSFSDDEKGDVDEFDLLEAALRQRPEYIVMGEIRGEEGRTLFQVMSTGHTTYTTFHADSVGEVLKRFTTDPINVSKTMFTALDLVSIQTQTRVRGRKVRRNKSLTEINHYDTENDEINVQDVYQWEAESDEYQHIGRSNTLEEILFDRGWDRERLEMELLKRETVLAYLIEHNLNQYQQVAATLQAFITDPETTLGLIANDTLEENLEDLREMESVLIDIDPEKEALVPRPEADAEMLEITGDVLSRAKAELFDEYADREGSIVDALDGTEPAQTVTAEPGMGDSTEFDTMTASQSDEFSSDGDIDATADIESDSVNWPPETTENPDIED